MFFSIEISGIDGKTFMYIRLLNVQINEGTILFA